MATKVETTFELDPAIDRAITALANGDILHSWINDRYTISYEVWSGKTVKSSGTVNIVATALDIAATGDGAVLAYAIGGKVGTVQFDTAGRPGAIATIATLPDERSVYEPELVTLSNGKILLHWLGIPDGQPPQANGGTFYNEAALLTGNGDLSGSVFTLLDSPTDKWRVDTVAASEGGGWTIAYRGDVPSVIRHFTAAGKPVGPEISTSSLSTHGGRDVDLAILDDGLIAYQNGNGLFDSFETLRFYRPNGELAIDIGYVGETNAHFSGSGASAGYQDGSFVVLPDGRLLSVFSAYSSPKQSDYDTDIYGRLFYANGVPQGGQFRLTSSSDGIQTRPVATVIDATHVLVSYAQSGAGGNHGYASIIAIDPAPPCPSTTGDDRIAGTRADDLLFGLEGDDRLSGGAGADRLYGGDGDDTLNGDAGYDRMIGGRGDDTYIVDNQDDTVDERVGEGIDTVISSVDYLFGFFEENLVLTGGARNGFGNGADNRITGTRGDNILTGASGDDTLDGGRGNDSLQGDEGDDVLIGGDGDDALSGEENDDSLSGGAGTDRLIGGEGADILSGGDGDDILTGDAGADILIGGFGRDLLSGGSGADIFRFESARDSPANASQIDRISGFYRGEGDKIDLSAIDADTTTRAKDDFAFVGQAAFSGHAGELRYISGGGACVIEADLNGDRQADFRIEESGYYKVVETDFILHASVFAAAPDVRPPMHHGAIEAMWPQMWHGLATALP